jgi:hypothetical protein
VEVQEEAGELNPGWEKHIWPQAMQYHTMLTKKNQEEADVSEAAVAEKQRVS